MKLNATALYLAGLILSALAATTILAMSDYLLVYKKGEDRGMSWYYWQLAEPALWSRITAWAGYALHQLLFWWGIFRARKLLHRGDSILHLNLFLLSMNFAFIFLHILQTHYFYDALAQDVSVWSALASVALMLVWVLMLENPRRGMFWGHPIRLTPQVWQVLKHYHGYFFSWAIVYTFWFHPAEANWGHLTGFFYIFLLFVQGSLFATPVHNNRYWTLLLELGVVAHGTMVAVLQGYGLWPMFLFGFLAVFILTQMHGLGLKRWLKLLFLAAYLLGIVVVYGQRGYQNLHEVIRIPLIDYALVFLHIALITFILKRLAHRGKTTLD